MLWSFHYIIVHVIYNTQNCAYKVLTSHLSLSDTKINIMLRFWLCVCGLQDTTGPGISHSITCIIHIFV